MIIKKTKAKVLSLDESDAEKKLGETVNNRIPLDKNAIIIIRYTFCVKIMANINNKENK